MGYFFDEATRSFDKAGRTKYTLARDEFIGKMQKLERKLDRKQQREDRYESMRY